MNQPAAHPFVFALHTLLEKEQLHSLLLIGKFDCELAINDKAFTANFFSTAQLEELKISADIAVLKDCLEKIDKKQGLALIANLRDVLTRRVLVDVNINQAQDWQQKDFIGLGFVCVARYEFGTEQHEIYAFDLRHYKPAPDWLNAKFWANPQLWGKHRW